LPPLAALRSTICDGRDDSDIRHPASHHICPGFSRAAIVFERVSPFRQTLAGYFRCSRRRRFDAADGAITMSADMFRLLYYAAMPEKRDPRRQRTAARQLMPRPRCCC